jgi:hypothetical protein
VILRLVSLRVGDVRSTVIPLSFLKARNQPKIVAVKENTANQVLAVKTK